MQKCCFLFLSALLLGACSLNAKQERELNKALSSYLNARNNGALLTYVAYSYPPFVKEKQSLGDSIFQAAFAINFHPDSACFLGNALLKEVQKNENTLQVYYVLDRTNENKYQQEPEKFELIALSENGGESWYFLNKTDYDNPTICPQLMRLIRD